MLRFLKKNLQDNSSRIFFTTDLHGSSLCFRKFLNAAEFYKVQVVIIGGDITGKLLIPIVDQGRGRFHIRHLGQIVEIDEDEVQAMEERIENAGNYPYRTNPDEVTELEANPNQLDALFSRLRVERVAKWMGWAEDKLADRGVCCFISPGNDDDYDIDALLQQSKVVTNPEGKVMLIDDDHEMASTGWSNPTPWDTPREKAESELEGHIEAILDKLTDPQTAIFNFHCPPYDTQIDLAPELDKNLKPVVVAGQPNMIPVGSKAVRRCIERHQPLLSLHGHIHESRGSYYLGRTLCLNPGSEYGEGLLRGVVLTLHKGEIVQHQFTTG